jgi:hypothetical protein
MRQEHEAAVARGLVPEQGESRPRGTRAPSTREPAARPKASAGPPRLKVVWLVCDVGGRTVETFAYAEKAEAEALAAKLKAQGKGNHFVRSDKVPMG